MADGIDQRKVRVRETVRAERQAMTAAQRSAAATGIDEQLRSLVDSRGARSLSCYLPIGHEPDTGPFLAWAHSRGLRVLLPSAGAGGQLDWIRDTGEQYVPRRFGISEPVGAPLGSDAVAHVDLMIIPACAVDRSGMRLGWGRGYFDRNLAALTRRPPVYAVVHETEFVAELPHEPHDVPVHGVVTSERVVTFAT